MGNVDGRQTGLIYPNEEIEVYAGRDQSIKLFTGKADTITTDSGGLHFKAYDNLALLRQEYITEEHQAEWRDTDVGVIIRAIIADSKWAPDANFVRTDTGIIAERLKFRFKSRLDSIKRLVELANSGEKRYVLYTDGAGVIHFRRYDDDTWPVAFMTTEDDLNHIVEDLVDNNTLFLFWFGEKDGTSGVTYEWWDGDDELTPYIGTGFDPPIRFYTPTGWDLSGRHRSKNWSQYTESGYARIASDPVLDIDVNQAFTIDLSYYPTDTGQMDLMYFDTPLPPQVHIAMGNSGAHCEVALGHSAGTMVWNPGITHDLNQWNYITLRVDSGDVSLFKNGTLSAGTSTGFTWAIDPNEIKLAIDPYTSSLTFDGYFDMLRLSKVSYSDQEIYNYARIQAADLVLTEISKMEMGGEKFNHCIVKYSEDIWSQYPEPCPDNPITKLIPTTSERTTHDCYIRAKAMVQSHTQVPTSYKAMAYSSRCDYRPNDLVEVYAPRYNIVGQFRLKNMTYTIRDNIRKLSMTLSKEDRELTQLLAIAGL